MTIEQTTFDCDLDIIREALMRQSGRKPEERVKSIKILQHIQRPYSAVSFLAVSTDIGSHRFVLKRMANNPLNTSIVEVSEQAVVEYDILSDLYPKFSTIERCSVPRPILALPEINAYLMEYVEGNILSDHLNFVHYLANATKFRQLQEHFHDCGRWLRHFQQFTGRRLANASAVDNVLLRCNDRLQLIEEADDPGCPRDFRKTATDYIEKQVHRLANTEVLVSGRHGDFGPWNILAGPGGITVIDFFGYREDPLPVDILYMLVFLDSQEPGLANSASRIRTLQKRFLAGFGPVPMLPEPLVLLCEAQQRIQRVAGRIIEGKKGFFSRWERAGSLRANVEWFMTPREKSSLWPR